MFFAQVAVVCGWIRSRDLPQNEDNRRHELASPRPQPISDCVQKSKLARVFLSKRCGLSS